jgi:hypothetical protein
LYTANEGPVRIQFKFLVPIYVFPEMKLLFPKQNDNVLPPSSYTYIYVRDFNISLAGKYVDRSWEYINRLQMRKFPEMANINGIFVAVYCGERQPGNK